MVPARRCSQPFDKNAGAVRRPRHFDSINSNFQRQPQRWVYQCRLASAVQKPPPSGLLSQTGHSSYEGYGHPGNVLLSGGLRLSKFNLTRWVAYPYVPHAGAQGAASRADYALLVHWAEMLQMGRRSSPQVVSVLSGVPRAEILAQRKKIRAAALSIGATRSEEHTSELQSLRHLVCRL